MLEESLKEAIDDAVKREYVDEDRDDERSRSEVLNMAAGLLFDQVALDSDDVTFLEDYTAAATAGVASPDAAGRVELRGIAHHVRCGSCGHRWQLTKPRDDYEDGPRCGECGSREVEDGVYRVIAIPTG